MKPLHFNLIVCVVACLLAGCGGAGRRAATGQSPSYYGETKTFEEVVAAVNANNVQVPTLWAKHYFEATIIDEKQRPHEVVGDGALLYRRPRGLLIRGQRPLAPPLFEIGSTDERYWLKVEPEVETMWWGEYANLGKPCVDKDLIPIPPNLVVEVLGLSVINLSFNEPPVPTMRFHHDAPPAYVFVWNAPLGNRWWAQREVWYDYRTFLPRLVILYDENGRVVLRAFLSDHQPVDMQNDVAEADRPKVATRYRLFFPANGTKMSFELSDMVLDKNGVPSRRGIVFPREPGVREVIQVDEGCNDG